MLMEIQDKQWFPRGNYPTNLCVLAARQQTR